MYVVPQLLLFNPLPGCAPDRLEETVLLCEPVEAVVALTHGANEAAEGVDLVLAGVAAVLVNLADAELDRGVVLGLDDASGGRLGGISIALRRLEIDSVVTHAFARDVNYGPGQRCVRCGIVACWPALQIARGQQAGAGRSLRSTSSPRSFSMVIDM